MCGASSRSVYEHAYVFIDTVMYTSLFLCVCVSLSVSLALSQTLVISELYRGSPSDLDNANHAKKSHENQNALWGQTPLIQCIAVHEITKYLSQEHQAAS